MKQRYLASGCLVGLCCRYDGKSKPHPLLKAMYEAGEVQVICPESLSGLPVPRLPAEQKDGRVLLKSGEDVTEAFVRGAELAFLKARQSGLRKVVLKARSPSCGVGEVYDGSFTGHTMPGDGIFTAMLKEAGFEVCTEEDFNPEADDV